MTHGGARLGAGRKPAPIKKVKNYLRLPIEQPQAEPERLALEWWARLTPRQRLEQIREIPRIEKPP